MGPAWRWALGGRRLVEEEAKLKRRARPACTMSGLGLVGDAKIAMKEEKGLRWRRVSGSVGTRVMQLVRADQAPQAADVNLSCLSSNGIRRLGNSCLQE